MGPDKESMWTAHLDVGSGGCEGFLRPICGISVCKLQLCGDDGDTKTVLCGWWWDWAHLGLKRVGP